MKQFAFISLCMLAFGFYASALTIGGTNKAHKHKTASKRAKPTTGCRFNGSGLIALLGGSSGKYLRHHHLNFSTCKTSGRGIKDVPGKEDIPSKLMVNFVGNSDSLINRDDTLDQLKKLAAFLQENKKANVVLTGNTGTNWGETKVPLGSGIEALNYPAKINGVEATSGELMIARAEAIKNLLVNDFSIKPSRIKTKAGAAIYGEGGRNVGVEVQ